MAVWKGFFLGLLLAGVAYGQTAASRTARPDATKKRMAKKAPAKKPAPVPLPAPAPESPKPVVSLRPSQMPAVPPRVSFQNGALTIVAENSTMADIITQLRAATGIKIETIGGPSGERVAARIGPAPVRDVILSLVQGSQYDFIILGVAGQPDAVERVILTPKVAGGAVTAAAPPRPNPGYNTVYQPQDVSEDDNEGFAPAPTPAQSNPSEQNAAPGSGPAKTPEQLLEELRRMEEQRNNPQGRSPRPPR